MLKAILQIIATIILGYLAHQFLPFWAMALAAGVVALLFNYKYGMTSFAAGFLAAFLLWCAYAYTLDAENTGKLSSQLGQLFQTNGTYLVSVTGLIGGVLGGFGALTATLAKRLFIRA